MRFEFATASRIIFGSGTLREAGPLARELGTLGIRCIPAIHRFIAERTLMELAVTINGQKRPDIANLPVKRLPASEQPKMQPNKSAQPPRQVLP